MLTIDLKARLKNKYTWIAIISAVILTSQQLGFDISQFIPVNWEGAINTIFVLLGLLGVVVDTSTEGFSDQPKTTTSTNITVAKAEEVVVNTTNTVDTSASAKITVDNPDNVQVVGQIINATSAVAPQ